MGATSSIRPEVFTLAKDEYELKKAEGLTDEQLFNHMKTFIDTKTAEIEAPDPTASVATSAGGSDEAGVSEQSPSAGEGGGAAVHEEADVAAVKEAEDATATPAV